MAEPGVVATRPSPLGGLVEDYLAHCRAAGLSPKTIRHAYGYPLRAVFLPWCAERGISELAQLSNRVLDRFVGDLLEHGGKRGQLSKHTVWTCAKAAKRFLAWVKAEGQKVEAEVKLPKLPRRLVETLYTRRDPANGRQSRHRTRCPGRSNTGRHGGPRG